MKKLFAGGLALLGHRRTRLPRPRPRPRARARPAPVPGRALGDHRGEIRVVYVELYGGKVGAAAKQYTSDPARYGWRLFDVLVLSEYAERLDWPAERIAAWRDGGGQPFLGEDALAAAAGEAGLELTPRLFTMDAGELPTDIEKTNAWLAEQLPMTRVKLDDDAPGGPEGIVLRTADRRVIAKARFQDYARTLKRRRR